MTELNIDSERCNLCEKCLGVCPFAALKVEGGALQVTELCVLCGACVKKCPEDALGIAEVKKSVSRVDSGRWRGVWVVVERDPGRGAAAIEPVSCELAARARCLADELSTTLSAVVMGDALDDVTEELCRYSFDSIYRVESERLADFRSDIYASVLSELVMKKKPEILLCGATADGRAFFPRTAALLHTGLTADCTALAVDPARRILLQTRPAFGGNVMATIECPEHRPQMATVRPNVMPRPAPGPVRDVELIDFSPTSGALRSFVSVLETIEAEPGTAGLAEADVIVAGGRGVGGAEGFELLSELAGVLGGVVGASRAAVDSGWMPYARQIGQTGRVVQPGLYIACGISGAVQHLVGMRSADIVVAINTDPGAPIFEVADLGFVGDLKVIVPQFMRYLGDSARSMKKSTELEK